MHTLSAQTSSAIKRTLRCQAALIEDLLTDGFDLVLTARLQSDPPAEHVMYFENIMKLKSLVQEGLDIDDSVKVEDVTEGITQLVTTIEDHLGDTVA